MKKYLCMLIALLLVLSACGKNNSSKPAAQSGTSNNQPAAQEGAQEEASGQSEAAEQSGTPVKDEVAEPEPVHPYAWMGLETMPSCNYLDILCSNHYYQVYDVYDSTGRTETAEAADGIDSCLITAASRSLALNGMFYYIDENEMTVAQYDYTDSTAQAKAYMESVMAEGTNIKGRAFEDTGRSVIPLYASMSDDSTEYEYYEFLTSNPGVNEITERFYMKDGDVFAIYTKTVSDDAVTESTNVIKSISADIPAGIFTVPDLSGYTELS